METKSIFNKIKRILKIALVIVITLVAVPGCFSSIGGSSGDEPENVCEGNEGITVNASSAQCEIAGGVWRPEQGCYCLE